MKSLIIISVMLAVAAAKPSATYVVGVPKYYTAPLLSQYHTQDEYGQYTYGYNGVLSAKTETKTIDGLTRGAYSYIDSNGKLQSVEYTADAEHGFRVAATNLPKIPIYTTRLAGVDHETYNVEHERLENLRAHKEAEDRYREIARLHEVKHLADVEHKDREVVLETVRETPEVAQARLDHLKVFREVEQRDRDYDSKKEILVTEAKYVRPEFKTAAHTEELIPVTREYTHPVVAVKTTDYPYKSYAYSISSPYVYTYGTPYVATHYTYPYVVPYTYTGRTPEETPEVLQAKAEHFAAHAKHLALLHEERAKVERYGRHE